MKVFPGAVAVPALAWDAGRHGAARFRGTRTFLATLGAGLALWLALGGARVWSSVAYHVARGVEVGSLYAGGLLLAGHVAGADVPLVFNFKAYHVASAWGARWATLALPLQVAALALVGWRFRRGGLRDGVHSAGAAILAFVVAGKVLSPQYLIWLFPFVAALNGPTGHRARQVFLVGCLATAVIYPGPGFGQLLEHRTGAILILNLRNALLLWLLCLLLLESGPETAPAPTHQSTVAAP
jgi:hypothetical protein